MAETKNTNQQVTIVAGANVTGSLVIQKEPTGTTRLVIQKEPAGTGQLVIQDSKR